MAFTGHPSGDVQESWLDTDLGVNKKAEESSIVETKGILQK